MSGNDKIPAPYVGGEATLAIDTGNCDAHDMTEAALVMVDIIKTLAIEAVHGQVSSRENIAHAINLCAITADLYGQAALRLMSATTRATARRVKA